MSPFYVRIGDSKGREFILYHSNTFGSHGPYIGVLEHLRTDPTSDKVSFENAQKTINEIVEGRVGDVLGEKVQHAGNFGLMGAIYLDKDFSEEEVLKWIQEYRKHFPHVSISSTH